MKSIFRHRHFSRLYSASAAMVKLRFFYLMYLCVTATCLICSRVCVRCRSTDLGNQIIKVSIISKAQGNTVCMDVLSVRVSSSVLLARRYVRRINATNDPSPLSFPSFSFQSRRLLIFNVKDLPEIHLSFFIKMLTTTSWIVDGRCLTLKNQIRYGRSSLVVEEIPSKERFFIFFHLFLPPVDLLRPLLL